jgi:hypothetical protein
MRAALALKRTRPTSRDFFFSDEATFHACGTVKMHSCLMWESGNLHDITEEECDSPFTEGQCMVT